MNRVVLFQVTKKLGLSELLMNRYRRKKFRNDRQALLAQLSQTSLWKFDSQDFPILTDWDDSAGVMSGHYFHQDLWVASLIHQQAPARHVDIGSRIDGFVAHVASFREIEVLDIRQVESHWPNIVFKQADLMNEDGFEADYTDSVSSLHAIEHFGLGRYGDPIDAFGYLKAIHHIHRMLKPGGVFYFSVPIGPQRIVFNAHRVFSVKYILEIMEGRFTVSGFSFVDDAGDFHPDVALTASEVMNNFGCQYGCGIFVLKKI